jgi:hypothetical protein
VNIIILVFPGSSKTFTRPSIVSNEALNKFPSAKIRNPTQMPNNKERNTSRVQSASPIATTGGNSEIKP